MDVQTRPTAGATSGNFRGRSFRYSIENARTIHHGLKEAGIDFVCYLPDSWNYQVLKEVLADKDIQSAACSREDEGIAMAMGAYLGGKRPAMIMEGSGYGMSGLVLARPGLLQRMPLLIVSSHTSALGEIHDYHGETRFTVEPILQALGIPHVTLMDISAAKLILREAQMTIEGQLIPVAVLLPRHILFETD
jgi:sulfopyruvate decarboxylase subunit alpha